MFAAPCATRSHERMILRSSHGQCAVVFSDCAHCVPGRSLERKLAATHLPEPDLGILRRGTDLIAACFYKVTDLNRWTKSLLMTKSDSVATEPGDTWSVPFFCWHDSPLVQLRVPRASFVSCVQPQSSSRLERMAPLVRSGRGKSSNPLEIMFPWKTVKVHQSAGGATTGKPPAANDTVLNCKGSLLHHAVVEQKTRSVV